MAAGAGRLNSAGLTFCAILVHDNERRVIRIVGVSTEPISPDDIEALKAALAAEQRRAARRRPGRRAPRRWSRI